MDKKDVKKNTKDPKIRHRVTKLRISQEQERQEGKVHYFEHHICRGS